MVEQLDPHAPERYCYVCGELGKGLLRITVEKWRHSECCQGSPNFEEYRRKLNEEKNFSQGD